MTVANAPGTLDFGSFKAHDGCARRGFPGGQKAFIEGALRHKVACALNGRDSGKTYSLEILFWIEAKYYRGLYENIYVAQGHPQAEKTFEKHLKYCERAGTGFLIGRKNKGQDRWVETRSFGKNGGTIRHFWSGEESALTNVRGPRAARLTVDEAGMCHKSVIPVCWPMLGSRNGKAAFVGTATRGGMGRKWFEEMWRRGNTEDKNYDPNYVSFNFPIESSPYLSDETCRFNRSLFRDPNHPDEKTLEEREECDGAFVSDIGTYFRNLDACFTLPFVRLVTGSFVGVDEHGQPIVAIAGRRYVIGVDWARKRDRTVFSVFDRVSRNQVELRIEPTERSYDEYLSHLSPLKEKWNDALIVADDRGAGEYANSRLASVYGDRYKGISLTGLGENAKGEHASRMRDLFDTEAWRFLNIPQQRQEFEDYEQRAIGDYASGYNYSAPAGKHDDTVSAAMFASTVLQMAVRAPRVKRPDVEAFSREWFEKRAKDRTLSLSRRRGAW